jgi:hypothetical protein
MTAWKRTERAVAKALGGRRTSKARRGLQWNDDESEDGGMFV